MIVGMFIILIVPINLVHSGRNNVTALMSFSFSFLSW